MTYLHQLEARVRRIVDRVRRNAPIEDSLVELKTDWPAPVEKEQYKFTRQLAGHANASGGAPILWLIGVNEKGKSVPGASASELSSWYAIFRSHFESVAPNMLNDLVVDFDGAVVVAMEFDTSMAPYVLDKTHLYPPRNEVPWREVEDAPDKEVPWRQATSVRTAKRSDLVRLLAPVEAIPSTETVDCMLTKGGPHSALQLKLAFEVYVYTRASERVTFPLHKCAASIGAVGADGKTDWVPMRIARIRASSHRLRAPGATIESKTVIESASETIVSGAGMITVIAAIDAKLGQWEQDIEAAVSLWVLEADRPIRLTETLARRANPKTSEVEWVAKQTRDESTE